MNQTNPPNLKESLPMRSLNSNRKLISLPYLLLIYIKTHEHLFVQVATIIWNDNGCCTQ